MKRTLCLWLALLLLLLPAAAGAEAPAGSEGEPAQEETIPEAGEETGGPDGSEDLMEFEDDFGGDGAETADEDADKLYEDEVTARWVHYDYGELTNGLQWNDEYKDTPPAYIDKEYNLNS